MRDFEQWGLPACQMGSVLRIHLRPATDADLPLLDQLYASTREMELAQVPWTSEQKQAFLEMKFQAQRQAYPSTHPDASHDMICVDDESLGRVYPDRTENFHLLDISIAPERRHRNIRSRDSAPYPLRSGLEAAQAGQSVSIYTETFKPSRVFSCALGLQQKSVDGFLVLLEKPIWEGTGKRSKVPGVA